MMSRSLNLTSNDEIFQYLMNLQSVSKDRAANNLLNILKSINEIKKELLIINEIPLNQLLNERFVGRFNTKTLKTKINKLKTLLSDQKIVVLEILEKTKYCNKSMMEELKSSEIQESKSNITNFI